MASPVSLTAGLDQDRGTEPARGKLAPSRKLMAAFGLKSAQPAAERSALEPVPLPDRVPETESSPEASARLVRQCLAGDAPA